jgi:hypothetical protein
MDEGEGERHLYCQSHTLSSARPRSVSSMYLFCYNNMAHNRWFLIITIWNGQNTDRPQTLARFQVNNYPPKYIKSLGKSY